MEKKSFNNLSFSISVVIPTYNRIKILRKCLPTFLATKVRGVQFIIIDNNSNDETWNYLQTIALRDKRVEIFKNLENIGASKSILKGYKKVKSPYVLNLSDQYPMVGDYIASCLEIFQKNNEVSLIHHEFDVWQKKKFDEKYTKSLSGNNTINSVFLLSGVLSGFAFRMRDYQQDYFPVNGNVLYPQVKIALELARRHSVAFINDCGMVRNNIQISISDKKKQQKRPDCMGINERLTYLLELKNPLLIQKSAIGITDWAINILIKLKKDENRNDKKFVKALAFTLNNTTPYYLISLLKIRRFKHAFFSLSCLILKPSFVINYFWFLVFFISRLINKI